MASSKQTSPQLITMGCRLNIVESEIMRDHAKAQGLENAVILNTCAVTNEAERQSRQAVRRARRENPEAKIIVTGCSVQLNPDVYAQMPEVDHILGNQEKMKAESFNFAAQKEDNKVHVTDIMTATETAHHLISGFENHVRTFVQIQNGCDHRCTFCTIPFARGNNRSVPVGAIVQQIKTLIDRGSREVVLTGVDITGYGPDLPGKPALGDLVRRILNQVPELQRLRLSSLDPSEVDEDLFDLMVNEPRLMPHFHLSLQAGDNMILKRMKRRHLREDAIEFVQRIKAGRSDAVFGADIIAGFPTETEEMHQNSLRIIEECHLTYLHVFPYSARQGTPAARMPQVSKSLIKQRAAALRQKGEKRLETHYKSLIGKTVSVLMESKMQGRCEYYTPVRVVFPVEEAVKTGQIISVKVTDASSEGVQGKYISG